MYGVGSIVPHPLEYVVSLGLHHWPSSCTLHEALPMIVAVEVEKVRNEMSLQGCSREVVDNPSANRVLYIRVKQ